MLEPRGTPTEFHQKHEPQPTFLSRENILILNNPYERMSDDLLSYEEDKRNTNPDSNHLRNFNAGWTEALKDDPDKSKYKENPELPNLTWENLGYRLGCLFGETTPELRKELFKWCKEQQADSL